MKKIVTICAVLLASCTVIRSPYLPQVTYWGTLVTQTSIAATDQAKLAYEASKNGLKDSAEYYTLNAIAFGILTKQYTDSMLVYINKK